MMPRECDVCVIGGGLHGLSAALHLARDGRGVILLERSWIGRHASGASAAGVRTLWRDLAEVPLSLEAMDMWHAITDLVGDDCGFHAHGQIKVAETDAEMAVLAARIEKLESLGHRHERLVHGEDVRRIVPAIAPGIVGGAWAERDGAADPHRTLRAFRRAAEAAGVRIVEGQGVTDIQPASGGWIVSATGITVKAETVVNAAGAWAAEIARLVGEDIPLGTKASMMIVTERLAPFVAPVVSAVGRKLSFKQTDRGTLLLGGGVQGRYDLAAEKTIVDFPRLAAAARAATALFPSIGAIRIARCWSGLEAKTADLLPVIGESSVAPGVFHAFGFSGHGFQLVPVVGATIADLVVRGGTNRAIAAFRADRLSAGERAA